VSYSGRLSGCVVCYRVWQHVDCMEVDRKNIPDSYMCELCQPRLIDKHHAIQIQTRKRDDLCMCFITEHIFTIYYYYSFTRLVRCILRIWDDNMRILICSCICHHSIDLVRATARASVHRLGEKLGSCRSSSSSFIRSVKQLCAAMQYSGAGQQGPRKDTDSWQWQMSEFEPIAAHCDFWVTLSIRAVP